MIEPHPATLSASPPQAGFQQMTALLQVIADGQTQLAETQQQIRSMVERIIAAIEAQAAPAPKAEAPPTPKIATYEQMYGPIPAPTPLVTPEAPPTRRHWLMRWLVREEAR